MGSTKGPAPESTGSAVDTVARHLGATDGERLFAAGIAQGVYTLDDIPPTMDRLHVELLAELYAQEPPAPPPSDPILTVDDGRGHLVRVPASRLKDYQAGQKAVSDGYTTPPEVVGRMMDKLKSDPAPASKALPPVKVPPKRKTDRPAVVFWCVLALLCICAVCVSVYLWAGRQDAPPSSGSTSVTAPAHKDAPAAPSSSKDSSGGAASDSSLGYVGSVNSEIVHKVTCRYVDNIPVKNRVYFSSVDRAKLAGRVCCSVCLPDGKDPAADLPPLAGEPRPETGEIIREPLFERVAPLTVETGGEYDYFISLVRSGNSYATMTFYIRAGETADVDVPLGEFEIYYATGPAWYGEEKLFGVDTEYRKCDGTFRFYLDEENYYQGYTLTFRPVINGNLDTDYISAEDFPT